jgi:peptidoglycan hydrolase CwlO-like protein
MALIKAKWVEQSIKDGDLVKQRETQLNELRNQLAKIKGQVDAMLARQSAIESVLFDIQREVAVTLDEVYQFEADLAERERKLAGGGK